MKWLRELLDWWDCDGRGDGELIVWWLAPPVGDDDDDAGGRFARLTIRHDDRYWELVRRNDI